MTYIEAENYIKKSYDKEIKLGLDRIRILMDLLGNPQDSLKFIHVAGTNGKGSVCAMTSEILIKAGYTTGLFTSPVICEYREQFKVNGEMITEDEFSILTEQIQVACDKMEDKPSEFEKAVALAFLFFKDKSCDLVVLEVGMGGNDDATNVINNTLVSVITNIDYDHMGFLGESLLEIAKKKAGIIKAGSDVVFAEQNDAVMELITCVCMEKGTAFKRTTKSNITIIEETLSSQVFDYKDFNGIELSLLGRHQCENAAIVIELMECLKEKGYNVDDDSIYDAMKQVKWPGRFEILSKEPLFIVDGAHNPNGIDALCANLDAYLPEEKIVFVVGILRDKDYNSMLKRMIPYAKGFVTIEPRNPRAMTSMECARAIQAAGFVGDISIEYDHQRAIKSATLMSKEQNPICTFGSLYNVGAIKEAFYSAF